MPCEGFGAAAIAAVAADAADDGPDDLNRKRRVGTTGATAALAVAPSSEVTATFSDFVRKQYSAFSAVCSSVPPSSPFHYQRHCLTHQSQQLLHTSLIRLLRFGYVLTMMSEAVLLHHLLCVTWKALLSHSCFRTV